MDRKRSSLWRLLAAALLAFSGLLSVSISTASTLAPLDPSPRETPAPPAAPDPLEPAPPALPGPGTLAAAEAPAEPLPPALTSAELEGAAGLLREWARSWSEQRVEDSLALYAMDFRCPHGWPRERWEREHRERLSRPTPVEITVHGLEVWSLGAGRLSVSFQQRSRSGSDSVARTLVLARRDGAWKIVEERAAAP